MKEIFFPQGLPKLLKNKAVVIERGNFEPLTWKFKQPRSVFRWLNDVVASRHDTVKFLTWKFEDIPSLFEWLTDNDLIVNYVGVYEIKNAAPVFRIGNWIYEGDHVSSFEISKQKSRLGAHEFIKEAEATKTKEMVFTVYFESTNVWDHLKIEFFNRAINDAGTTAYTAEDGLDLIDRCREEGRAITAIEAFIINRRFIQPQDFISYSPDSYDSIEPDLYLKIYHINKYTDAGHWEEAKEYVRDGGLRGWVFDIDYEIEQKP